MVCTMTKLRPTLLNEDAFNTCNINETEIITKNSREFTVNTCI